MRSRVRLGPPAARRLALWLFLTTVVPATALAGLGWALVREDRAREVERRRDAREQAATLAATALSRVLAELEDQLSTISVGPPFPAGLIGEGAAVATFGRGGTFGRAGLRLPYYPEPTASAPPRVAALERSDFLEFRLRDLAGAVTLVQPLTTAADPAIRAEALLRLGRLQRKMGQVSAAIDAFERLTALDHVVVNGEPAGLLGSQARALTLAEIGRHDQVAQIGATLVADLDSGRWLLSSTHYAFAREQAARWLAPRATPATSRLATNNAPLAAAAEMVWTAWRRGDSALSPVRGRLTLWAHGVSVLALTRNTGDQLTAMLVSPRVLEHRWRDVLPAADIPNVEIALTDGDGRTVIGDPRFSPDRQAVRTTSTTALPWTVHAIDAEQGSRPRLSTQARYMLAAIGVMMLAVAAGAFVTTRSLVREMRVSRLQSDFVSAVSHEFRTPLTAVRHLSQLLLQGRVSTDSKRTEFHALLVRESDRLHRLVESLLNFARLEAGELEYRLEILQPGQYLRSIVHDAQQDIGRLDARICLNGDTDELPTIRADRDLLGLVFWNLIDNSFKYSPGTADVTVSLEAVDRDVYVHVRDRGMGIPAVEHAHVFQKFARGAAAKAANIKGTGIGLAMAREIVRAHGGEITIDSVVGEGSTFSVRLPAAERRVGPA